MDDKEPVPGRIPVWPAYISAAMLWASFHPLALGGLAWLAIIGWLYFVYVPNPLGRREYIHLWLSGCLFWLLILQGIRLAYWPLYFGWLALGLYLAVYTPLFVWCTRNLLRRLPYWLAIPSCWVALEFVRSYMLTGYCANMLGHSQARYPLLIQIADQLGVYGVSFVIATASSVLSAFLFQALLAETQPAHPWRKGVGSLSAILLLVATLGYGAFKLNESQTLATASPLLRVALIQGNTPSMFDADMQSLKAAWGRYLELSRSAREQFGELDLVVWPESTFSSGVPWVSPELPQTLPQTLIEQGADREFLEEWIGKTNAEMQLRLSLLRSATETSDSLGPAMLLGADGLEIRADTTARYNSALMINADGRIEGHYNKMHLVMFGEYVPLGPILQWLRDLFGLHCEPGDKPKNLAVGKCNVSPNICFESMMPRVIQTQVRSLTDAGQTPDVLVNLTNDSWFRGSSMLDHHLSCSILCAVENRRPMLVAANTGISAEISGAGVVVQSLDRFQEAALLAEPRKDGRFGLVQWLGYPFAWACVATLAFMIRTQSSTGQQKRRDQIA